MRGMWLAKEESVSGRKEGGLEVAVYVFSLLVGYKPNGVDYAQGYRAKILSKLTCPIRYIFAELPGRSDIDFYKSLGIPEEDMFSMYHYLLDHPTIRPTVRAKDKLAELMESMQLAAVDYHDSEIRLVKEAVSITPLTIFSPTSTDAIPKFITKVCQLLIISKKAISG